jgi:hypothetical protein
MERVVTRRNAGALAGMNFFIRNCGSSITAASLLVGLTVFLCGTHSWYGDSHTFLNYAWDIADGVYNPYFFFRPPGYPILMVLSGATSGNLQGLFLLQTIVASSIAPMIYLILLPASRRAAAVTATIAIVSLIPYDLALTVYPDVFYMAGLVLLTLLVSRWMLGQGGFSQVYGLTSITLFLAWLRPVGLLFAFIGIPVLLNRRGVVKHVAICAIAFIGINAELEHWHNKFSAPQSMLGRQLFLNLYLNDLDITLPGIGELRDVLIKTGGDAVEIDTALRERTFPHYWYLFRMGDLRPVNPQVDRAFLDASAAQLGHHPIRALSYFLDHYLSFVTELPWRYEDTGSIVADPVKFAPNVLRASELPARTYRPIDPTPFKKPPSDITRAADLVFATVYPFLVPISFWLMIVGAVVLWRTPGPERTILFTALVIHSINVAALAMLCDPRLRYHIQSVPLAMIGAGAGLNAVVTLLRKPGTPVPAKLPA